MDVPLNSAFLRAATNNIRIEYDEARQAGSHLKQEMQKLNDNHIQTSSYYKLYHKTKSVLEGSGLSNCTTHI